MRDRAIGTALLPGDTTAAQVCTGDIYYVLYTGVSCMNIFLYQTSMRMKDHVSVISENWAMLVESLSSNTEVLKNMLDTLLAKGVMPTATNEDLLIKEGASPAKKSHQVREFLTWLTKSHDTRHFAIFYDAVSEQDFQSELEKLQSHALFQAEDKSEVRTCTGISIYAPEFPCI